MPATSRSAGKQARRRSSETAAPPRSRAAPTRCGCASPGPGGGGHGHPLHLERVGDRGHLLERGPHRPVVAGQSGHRGGRPVQPVQHLCRHVAVGTGGQFLGAEDRREIAVYLGGGLTEAVCLAEKSRPPSPRWWSRSRKGRGCWWRPGTSRPPRSAGSWTAPRAPWAAPGSAR